MYEFTINELRANEDIPFELLLLADPSPKAIRKYITDGEMFVGRANGEVVGVIVLVDRGASADEVINVAVDEAYQGRGIGNKLIRYAMAYTKCKGKNYLEIGTGNSSLGQLALYQKLGFRIVGVDQDFFMRNYDEVIYENGIQCVDMIRLSMNL